MGGHAASGLSCEWSEFQGKNIRIQIEDIDIALDRDTATTRFTQLYADERIKTINKKRIVWIKRGEHWLIQQELTE